MQRARDHLLALAAACAEPGAPAKPLPLIDDTRLWYAWEFWQREDPVARAYPLSVSYDAQVAFDVRVRANCDFAQVDAGVCAPNADGGLWAAGKGAVVTLQVMNSRTEDGAAATEIRYTLDGSMPTPASAAYVPGSPVNLDDAAKGAAQVRIRAAAFNASSSEGAILGGIVDTMWRAI